MTQRSTVARLPLHGGCLCGADRYTLHAAAQDVYHCHCQMCRKAHGAALASFGVVPVGGLAIDKGADGLTTYESSPGVRRQFCRRCGCQLFCSEDSRPGVLLFTAATLDDGAYPGHPAEHERHVYVGSKLPWFTIGDGLPQKDMG